MRTILVLSALLCFAASAPPGTSQDKDKAYTDTFLVDEKELTSVGRNPYFSLEIGYQRIYETEDKKEKLTVTVLEETKTIEGIETRVVEEREEVNGKVKELSRNYFAICKRTNNVYYYGEDAGGAWLHGKNGARFGLLMPGSPHLGARYCQEVAPGVAMDRAEVVSLTETFECPAGKFEKVLKTLETTPLDPKEHAYKLYAPGVGLLKDGDLRLIKYGKK